jgi:prepilin-type N-terminal cleavage/methylation domain-containing protein
MFSKKYGSALQKGFTLVELLIVVIILAILAAIVVPQFSAQTQNAQSAAADTSLANLRAAIDLYAQQHNGAYPGSTTAAPSAACSGTSGAGAADTDTAFLEQLTLYTDADGGACSVRDANHQFGPYLTKPQLPDEPFGNSNALEIVTAGDLNLTANVGDPGGYRYDTGSGRIIINLAAEQGR